MRDVFTPNAHRLFRSKAYLLRVQEPFTLVSGQISPAYMDCARLQNYPAEWSGANDDYAELVKEKTGGNVDRIAGGVVRDLPFSIPVAERLHLPHVIIREQEKHHGVGGRLVANIYPRERVAIVSDLMTSGKSSLEWIQAVVDAGGEPKYVFTFFDRCQGGEEKIRAALAKTGRETTMASVVQMDQRFYQTGLDGGHISREEFDELHRYLEDPKAWGRNYLRKTPEFLTARLKVVDGKLTDGEGIRVLIDGYPDMIEELAPRLREALHRAELKEEMPAIAFSPGMS